MIKSWVFELFVPPAELAQRFDPAVSQRHFNAYLDLWASAESAGFDGIFFSEHHFGATYSPAPITRELNDETIQRVRARRAELFRQWSAVPVGGTLTLEL